MSLAFLPHYQSSFLISFLRVWFPFIEFIFVNFQAALFFSLFLTLCLHLHLLEFFSSSKFSFQFLSFIFHFDSSIYFLLLFYCLAFLEAIRLFYFFEQYLLHHTCFSSDRILCFSLYYFPLQSFHFDWSLFIVLLDWMIHSFLALHLFLDFFSSFFLNLAQNQFHFDCLQIWIRKLLNLHSINRLPW